MAFTSILKLRLHGETIMVFLSKTQYNLSLHQVKDPLPRPHIYASVLRSIRPRLHGILNSVLGQS